MNWIAKLRDKRIRKIIKEMKFSELAPIIAKAHPTWHLSHNPPKKIDTINGIRVMVTKKADKPAEGVEG